MTNERVADTFMDALDEPAALCTPELVIRCANQAFIALFGHGAVEDLPLRSLFPDVAGLSLEEGQSAEVELAPPNRPRVLRLTRREGSVALLVPTPSLRFSERRLQLEQALLEVGREVAGAVSEEQLVGVVAQGVKRLFPERFFCVRFIDAKTGLLTSLYAEGRLKPSPREVLVLRRSAVQKTRLKAQGLVGKVQLTDGLLPLMFEGASRGVSAPLVASGQLFGLINLEYPDGGPGDIEEDERLLVQLANQASVGVRNAKLIDELTFMQKYLEELLQTANALIVVTDRERLVKVFNQAFSALTGLRQDEVLGRDLLELVTEAERPRVLGVLSDSLRGERARFEAAVRAPGGREVRVALSTAGVLSPEGEVEGIVAIGQDLTAIRELERQVVQAEKLSSLGTLAASVAHEINNPMTAVAAYVESMIEQARTDRPLPKDLTDKLQKIRDNSQRILRFTHDLVSYARPAVDRPHEMSLHPTIDLAISFCGHVLDHHHVQVEKSYGSLPPILGVPAHLAQVFVNLITNACHAMEGGGVVTISTGMEDGRAVVRVDDTGSGITPEDLSQIFEPFFTTKPAGKGTGLGLSIVHGIVEKHGGRIEVQSAPGKGSRFCIRLPIQ